MKKSLFTIVFTLLLAFSFVGCTPDSQTDSKVENTTATASGQAATEQEYTNDIAMVTSDASAEAIVSDETVISTEIKTQSDSKDSNDGNKGNKGSTASYSGGQVTYDYAKSVALKHVGAKENQIRDYDIELDRENGKLVYEISFDYNGYEYDIYLDAATGEVLRNKKEPEKAVKPTPAPAKDKTISRSEAKTIALKHAGVKASQIWDYEIELDNEDGIKSYEISFNAGKFEYEYDIKASNGKIIKSKKEFSD